MEGLLLFAEIFVCCVTALSLLCYYGDIRRQNRVSSAAAFLSWFLSFLMLFLLPVDIASTLYRQCVNHLPNVTSSTISPTTATTTTTSTTTTASTTISTARYTTTHNSTILPLLPSLSSSYSNDLLFADEASACVKPWVFVHDDVLQV